jgi:DHA1 family bicyclomycin/chloramphenicol resistance-like MFS transporter
MRDPLFASRDYRLLLIIGLLWGSSTSQLTMLAAIFRAHGFDDRTIAATVSLFFVGLIGGGIIAGSLTSRIGAKMTLLTGLVGSLVGIVGLPIIVIEPGPVLALSLARGLFGGLILPPGFLLVQTIATEPDRLRAIGIFNACFLIPAIYAPTVGEWAFRAWGEGWFFATATLPAAITILLACALSPSDRVAPSAQGYLALLRDRRIWSPCLAMAATGIGYAFAFNFLSLLISPVGWFFVPFALGLFITRFVGLGYLQRLPAWRLASFGLLAYVIGFAAILIGSAVVAGLAFGCGYGVVGPTAIAWGSAPYPRTEASRARPVALVTVCFNLGSIVAAQVTGAALPTLGWSGLLLTLAVLLLLILLACAAPGIARQKREMSA